MIKLWDFACTACGQRYPSHPYEGRRPETIPCACGEAATWDHQRANIIHPSHSGRKYGEFDPQFGCVVEDYAHKKRLLKEHGMHELPPETLEEAREGPLHAGNTAERDPNVIVADTMDEIRAKIPRDRVDHRATGGGRPDQDSWVKF
jgi:hypothetical protein